ncbi:hypothetical protein LINGRAHAP2_LOCUS28772 [Linum grandiflorum]
MARFNSIATIFLALVLIITNAVTFSAAIYSRLPFDGVGYMGHLQCREQYTAKDGEQCSDVAHKYKMSDAYFNYINPKVNCPGLLKGQLICTKASVKGFR